MHDADARRHHAEGVEGLHAPLHELVALAVALELDLHVAAQRVGRAVVVHLHRVVDHQVDRHQRFDELGVAALLHCHVTHRGQVGEQRHAGEVLQHHTGDHEGDLGSALCGRLPVGQFTHVGFGHFLTVAVAQHRFEHDADRYRQARDGPDAGGL